MIVRDYYVEVDRLPPGEGDGWIARVPGLPGCMSDASDMEELRSSIADAIDTWIVAARSMGRAVPRPAEIGERRA